MTPGDLILMQERINNLLKKINEKIDQVDRAFQAGMRKLEELKEWIGDVAEDVRKALVKLYNWAKTEIDKFMAHVNRVTGGFSLLFTMMEWDDKWYEIRNLANAVAVNVTGPQDRLDAHWEGKAAAKYFTVVTPQITAAQRVGVLAEKQATTMQSMVTQGFVFYGALAAALLAALGGLVGIIGGLVAAMPPLGLAGVVAMAGASLTFIGAFANFTSQQEAAGSQLIAEAGNSLGFAAGPSWPRAAAVSQDVTAADGDPADWTPIRP